MTGVVIIVLIFFLVAVGIGGGAYFTYRKKLRRAKAIERGLKMVPILIHLPPPSSDTQGGSRDVREVMREKTAQAEVLYNLLAGTATEGFKSNFYGQRHIALELIVIDGLVHFFAAVPVALVGVVKQAITTAYPGARLEEVEDHNIFNQEGRLAATLGGEMVLRAETAYPIATYEQLERDPMEAILTAVSTLEKQDGVAVQIMLRPAGQAWVKKSVALADSIRKGKGDALKFSAMDLAKAALKAPAERREEERAKLGGAPDVSQLQLSQVERIEEKTKHPGFEVLVRVIVSTGSVMRSQQLLREISTAFALYENPGMNGFKFLPAVDVQGLVTAFIFRFFPNELKSNVLSSAELATLFHLPDAQFTPSNSVARQQSKQVDGPVQLPTAGLLFGYNEFRGARKEIRLSPEDRRRHTYILGQTGTGKSTMLENLAVQDMLAGNGFAFIDPHGDSAEKLLALVPKERAEDVIYFNPADTQYPLGQNLFEFNDPAQKDFLVQETINMLYKLYDPGHTGIIGPRYEHWYRNAALTLMADPNGSTFIEIPKVFTDTEYLKNKFKYLKDPTVIDFWTKEMGQTSDYHKSEMLGWFVSKFGAFQNNEMMRNIIGQTKSSFNIREVMDKKKILIVNLSKGRIGELNSQLLGMIFVIKFQAAAMSRADMPEEQRSDFALYVDEFQNFSTDSFASILSEARKYRLNLIVANQFIGQLSNEIRDAVFGNIGTIVAHRMGPDDAEFMVKQFAPMFDAGDLVNIPNYHAAMRLMIGGLPSQPFTIADSAPLGAPNAELGVAVKQLSAAKYGHDKLAVEADLAQRLTGKAPVAAVAVAPSAVPVAASVATVAVAAPSVTPVPATVTDPNTANLATLALAAAPTAPSVAQPAAPANAPTLDMAHLAITPPPIGAPPVDINSAGPGPALPASKEPEPEIEAAIQASAEMIPEPEAQTAAEEPAASPALIRTPPPIGAPPVDVPEITSPNTLSLNDITGLKKVAPKEDDPYAAIDVLGPSAPKVAPAPANVQPETQQPEAAPEPGTDVDTAKSTDADWSDEPQPLADSMAEEPAPTEPTGSEEETFIEGLPEGVHILEQPAEAELDAKPTPEPEEAAIIEPEPTPAPATLAAEVTASSTTLNSDLPLAMEPTAKPDLEAEPEAGLDEVAPAATVEPAVPLLTEVSPVPAITEAPEATKTTTSPIEETEHQIDDLLSVSLIHPDRRTPRLDMRADEPAEEKPQALQAASPGMRVIQPLQSSRPKNNEPDNDIKTRTSNETQPTEPTIADLQHPLPTPADPQPAAQPDPLVLKPMETLHIAQTPPQSSDIQPLAEPQPAQASEPARMPEVEIEESLQPEPVTTKPDNTPEPIPSQPVTPVSVEPVKPADPMVPVIAPQMPGSAVLPQAPADRQEINLSTPVKATAKDAKSLAPGEVSVDEKGNVVIGGI